MNRPKSKNLIGRLSVGRKLILIYALDLSAVIFVSTILINEKFIAIDFARKETIGNQYIVAIRDALFGVNGKDAASAVLAAEAGYGNVRGDLGSHDLAQSLANELLKQESADTGIGKPGQSVSQAAQALITRIGNQSNLILDPDLDSYYIMSLVVLRFPELLDLIGRIEQSARQAGLAAAGEKSLRLTEYLILEGRLDAVAGGIRADYSEAFAAGKPDLRMALETSRKGLLTAIEALRTVAHETASQAMDNGSASILEQVTLALQSQLQKTWGMASSHLDGLLDARIEGLFKRMSLHLGAAVILLLLILGVVYFVARQIALPIRRLSSVAENVRESGDYTLRLYWDSSDEIGRLISAFNTMLEQLDRSRVIEKELAIQARTVEAQRDLLEAVPIPLLVTSVPHHDVLHANVPAQAWLEGRTTDPWVTGLQPEARVRFFQQLADTGKANELEALWQGAGTSSWALLSARRLRYQEHDAVLTAFTPIGKLKQMEQRLALWSKVFESSSESILLTDQTGRILTANRAFCRSTGYDLAEVMGRHPTLLNSAHHPDGFYSELWQTATTRGSWQGEMWLQRKSGESYPVWAVLNSIRNESNQITHYILASLDISERKANEQRISHLAQHDILTDLPNRALCTERLHMALQMAERVQRRVAVLFIDLDRFKNINDSLGHHIGDGLLRSVSHRLREAVRSGDTVSRLAGDEFVAILSSVKDIEEINHFVDRRLIPLIRKPHNIEGADLHITCSIGIAVYPEDGREIDTLMRNADAAMYQAKTQGRNKAEFFTIEMDRCARERLMIETDLRVALETEQLRIYFQPRVDCRSGKLLGAEALVRWQHPEQGLISPGRFIPVAEESGLILPLGNWMLNAACNQQKLWRESGYEDIVISVNISAAQLHDPKLLETLRSALERHQVNPELIELELTESLLMEQVTATIELLHAIKALGVSLSLDDFGTGYSSLNYLHRFPIDKLKIDQSFVSDMLEDDNDLAITKAIIGLGHALGLRVVAEGVENIEEMNVLTAAGCDEFQGYLFGKPMPAEAFDQWRGTYKNRADTHQRIY